MSSTESAFGGMFQQLVELGVIEINTEPLDAHRAAARRGLADHAGEGVTVTS